MVLCLRPRVDYDDAMSTGRQTPAATRTTRASVGFFTLLLGLLSPLPALAQLQAPPPPAPPAGTPETLATAQDFAARMTVEVMVNGQGPFPFVVDTGADRSVVSDTLARQLALPAGPAALLHDITGTSRVETAVVSRLGVGAREITNIIAPVLLERYLGAMGLLGIDAVADQRLVIDFRAEQMTVIPSAAPREPEEEGAIVVKAKRRFGQLILVDAAVGKDKVYVIVDTGAQNSIANSALRRRLTARRAFPIQTKLVSVTGGTAIAEMSVIPEMRLGELTVRDLPVAYSDVHTFRQFGITSKPAMLLGMDMLRVFERISLDFPQKKVRFLLKEAD